MTPFAAIPQRKRGFRRRTKRRIDPPERRSDGVKYFLSEVDLRKTEEENCADPLFGSSRVWFYDR
jgi:hypothetical protein